VFGFRFEVIIDAAGDAVDGAPGLGAAVPARDLA